MKFIRYLFNQNRINKQFDKSNIINTFEPEEVNEHGYIFIESNDSVAEVGSITVMRIIRFSSITGEAIFVPVVFYDDSFKMLSENTRIFLVSHELYHFNLHKDLLLNNVPVNKSLERDYEADMAVVQLNGRSSVLSALNEVKRMVFLNREARLNICKRIEYIKKNS